MYMYVHIHVYIIIPFSPSTPHSGARLPSAERWVASIYQIYTLEVYHLGFLSSEFVQCLGRQCASRCLRCRGGREGGREGG